MTPEAEKFLRAVERCMDGARGKDLPHADRAQDRVRQSMRRIGYVKSEDRGNGRRWHITPLGKRMLHKAEARE